MTVRSIQVWFQNRRAKLKIRKISLKDCFNNEDKNNYLVYSIEHINTLIEQNDLYKFLTDEKFMIYFYNLVKKVPSNIYKKNLNIIFK